MYADIDKDQINKILSAALSTPVEVAEMGAVGGGSISRTFKLQTSAGLFILKMNEGRTAFEMFKTEAYGLDLLRENSKFVVPRVISVGTEGRTAYLIMEFVDSTARSSNYWQDLAVNLADLHRHTNSRFGLKEDNFIGSLPQQNKFAGDWASFFINRRILPMVKIAVDNGLVRNSFVTNIELALPEVIKLLPEEPPALIHGDLWSGNIIVGSQGQPCLIDPAVYYGYREMDIAFSLLFGGFDQEFYEAYQVAYPMQPGFDKRIDLYNLYPLLVHLNLFGRSYLGQIEQIISRFT